MGSDERHDRRIQTVCLLILTGLAAACILAWSKPLMVPFVVAVFAAFVLTPVVDFLVHRCRLPSIVAILSTMILVMTALAVVGLLGGAAIGQMFDNADMYQQRMVGLVKEVIEKLPVDRLGMDRDEAQQSLTTAALGLVRLTVDGLASATMDVILQGSLMLVFLVFLLAGDTVLSGRRGGTMAESASMVRRYLGAQISMSVLTGVLVGGVLWLLKVDLALTFGFLAFVLNFVPNIGSVIATLLPLPVVLLSPEPQTQQVVLVLLIPGAIQIVLGSFVVPKVMGQTMELHPITVLATLIFWGMLWGLVGVVLAVPITAVMRIWFLRFDYTRPIANLMAGRSPGGRRPPPEPTNATL
jgi:AI-2 transport protein TqsA